MSDRNTVLAGAMRLLATREHSRQELYDKLIRKGHPEGLIEDVLMELAASGLQSDERFVETFINSHRERGKGPRRIMLELQQHDIEKALIDDYLDENDSHWLNLAEQVRCKKFGNEQPADFQQRMKQAKFLEYRGFNPSQIFSVLDDDELVNS